MRGRRHARTFLGGRQAVCDAAPQAAATAAHIAESPAVGRAGGVKPEAVLRKPKKRRKHKLARPHHAAWQLAEQPRQPLPRQPQRSASRVLRGWPRPDSVCTARRADHVGQQPRHTRRAVHMKCQSAEVGQQCDAVARGHRLWVELYAEVWTRTMRQRHDDVHAR
eukprot:366485-Chlamydomonas_euryale.AAC.15